MTAHAAIQAMPDQSPIVEFWNDILAPKFIRYRHIMVGGLSRHSAAIMPELDLSTCQRVLDVGCGFGDTAIEISRKTGPHAEVVGVDCCQGFIDLARQLVEPDIAAKVRFSVQDIEHGMAEGGFDFAFSRFGIMFFSNPVAGLRAISKSLLPGSRMAHIVWRDRNDNPWLNAAHGIVRQFLPAPAEQSQSCGPGPFSMASENVTRAQMQAAGFRDIQFKRIDAKVLVGRDIEDAIGFQLAIGPAGEAYREAGETGLLRRPEIVAALAEFFATVETTSEGLWMDSSSWLITARTAEDTN